MLSIALPGRPTHRDTSDDGIHRDDDGTEYVVEWVTQQDVDLARRITEIAAGLWARQPPSWNRGDVAS